MAVEFVAIQEFKTDGGTSILMTAPIGTSVGDLLIAYISKDDNVAIYNTGSYGDWNMVFNNIANGQTCLYLAWKWAEAGDAAETKTQYTWNGDSEDWLGEILCYSGVKAVTPIHGTPGISTGTSATPTAPSVEFTALAIGSLVLQVMGIDQDDNDYVVPPQLTSRFNAIQAADIGGAGGDRTAPADHWASPTSFTDPDTFWNTENLAYDNNTATNAYTDSIGAGSWSSYIEYNIFAISCDKVRFYAGYNAAVISSISLDVYYDGGWQNIYEGAYTNYAWVEKAIGSTETVTAMRVRFYNNSGVGQSAFLREVSFWKMEGATSETGTALFTATSRPWAAATLVIEAAVAEGQYEYTGTGSFTYSGTAIQTHSRNYLTTASGQLNYSGSAEQVYSKDYLTAGSGSLAFSGEAIIIFGLAYVGSGSLNYSGEAIVTYTRDFISTAVGELIYSGEAIFSYLCNFLFTGSGELAYSGSAEYSLGFVYTPSGELTFSGVAVCEYTIAGADFEYVGSGTLAFSGTATQVYTKSFLYTGSGDFTYSGSATQTYTNNFSYIASGSFAFSGIGDYSVGFVCVGSGTYNFSGAGIYALGFAYVGSGEFIYSGIAECIYETEAVFYVYVGSGSLNYSGEAVYSYTFNYPYYIFVSIKENDSIILIDQNKSSLRIKENDPILSIAQNESLLSIDTNKSILSIEE